MFRKTEVEGQGEAYAKGLGIPHFQVSAKTGQLVN